MTNEARDSSRELNDAQVLETAKDFQKIKYFNIHLLFTILFSVGFVENIFVNELNFESIKSGTFLFFGFLLFFNFYLLEIGFWKTELGKKCFSIVTTPMKWLLNRPSVKKPVRIISQISKKIVARFLKLLEWIFSLSFKVLGWALILGIVAGLGYLVFGLLGSLSVPTLLIIIIVILILK